MSIALLIIDIQKKYIELPAFRETFTAATEYINYVSDMFRKSGQPVIHIQHVEPEENIESDKFRVADEIIQKDSDIYVHKMFGNGFWKTDLQKILEARHVDYVICCGLSATHCVLGTYNGAVERGFNASMLQNGLIGRGWEEVLSVQKERNVIGYNGISYILKLLDK